MTQVSAVCSHINEAKRRAEQQSALLALAQRCRDRDSQKLCSSHRLLLKEWVRAVELLSDFKCGIGATF